MKNGKTINICSQTTKKYCQTVGGMATVLIDQKAFQGLLASSHSGKRVNIFNHNYQHVYTPEEN